MAEVICETSKMKCIDNQYYFYRKVPQGYESIVGCRWIRSCLHQFNKAKNKPYFKRIYRNTLEAAGIPELNEEQWKLEAGEEI